MDALLQAVRAAEGPVVVAGDLNLSDRTAGYRTLREAGLRDAARSSAVGPTYHGGLLWATALLRIDHVLTTAELCSDGGRQVALPGSDHDAAEVTFGACAE